MVTVNVLRECWQRIVLAHKEGITFTSDWSEVLDTDTNRHLPNVKWMPPNVTHSKEGGIFRSNITCTLFFEDNHESDRDNQTRDDVYERMQVVASVCLMMFDRVFLSDETTHEGVLMAVQQEGAATITASFDQPGTQVTGAMLVVTYSTVNQICPDGYFNAV